MGTALHRDTLELLAGWFPDPPGVQVMGQVGLLLLWWFLHVSQRKFLNRVFSLMWGLVSDKGLTHLCVHMAPSYLRGLCISVCFMGTAGQVGASTCTGKCSKWSQILICKIRTQGEAQPRSLRIMEWLGTAWYQSFQSLRGLLWHTSPFLSLPLSTLLKWRCYQGQRRWHLNLIRQVSTLQVCRPRGQRTCFEDKDFCLVLELSSQHNHQRSETFPF